MNKIFETEKTAYIYGLMKDKKNIWKKIARPNKIVLIIDQMRGGFQMIIDSAEDLSDFYTDNLYGYVFSVTNDPQDAPYPEVTNLGYSSIKIHAIGGKFLDEGTFNYFTQIKQIEKNNKSVMLRNNFPYRFPNDIMGPSLPLFDNKEPYIIYKMSFIDIRPDYLVIEKLSNNGVQAVYKKTIHDMYNSANGSKILETKYILQEEFDKEMEKMLR